MQPPDKILDLIEATEMSAEKINYKFTERQQILLNRLKDKANRKMTVSNNYWELLCDLFNEVEGRKKPNHFEDGMSSTRMLLFYVIIPIFFFAIGSLITFAYMLGGR